MPSLGLQYQKVIFHLQLGLLVFVAWLAVVVGEQQRPGLVSEVAGGWDQTGEEGGTVVVGTLLEVAEDHSTYSAAGGGEEGSAVVATGPAILHPGNHARTR